MNNKEDTNNLLTAFRIGFLCIGIYLASFLFRNLLSVFTPDILDSGILDKSGVALLSSTYMVVYALGQLICGVVGDYIKARYMVFFGLCLSGIGLLGFTVFDSKFVGVICFAVLGLGLSSLRGPLVKTISENMKPKYARFCCVLLSFVSFFGPFVAGLFAYNFSWNTAFIISAVIAFVCAAIGLIGLTIFEKKQIIKYNIDISKKEKKSLGVFSIFKLESFFAYLFIGIVVETMATSVSFWTPTYLKECLGFSTGTASLVFSVMSLLKSFCPFLCLLLLPLFKHADMKLVFSMYIFSVPLFILMLFIKTPWINVVTFLMAYVMAGIPGAVMWSVYIPSLAKSGKVSGANGIFDCSGYFGAAVANMSFAYIMKCFDWNGVIIAWATIPFIGMSIAVLELLRRKRCGSEIVIEA